MQNFIYKQVDDGTFCVTEYTGDEQHVEIPDTWCGKPVTMLYDDLFKGHGEILSVRIPDTVREIGGFVFDGCVNLRAVTLPRSLEEMWQYAFARSGIEEIVLPDGMRSVVAFTFFGCRQLRKVTCGSGLRKIRARAFLGCDALKEVIHGEAVEVSPLAFGEKPAAAE